MANNHDDEQNLERLSEHDLAALQKVEGLFDLLRQTPAEMPGQETAITPTAVSDRPGVPSVAGYEILGELGRGGMGVVYKALHLELNRVVALKMVLAGAHALPEQLDRFVAEARAVARLQHPNIVQIFDVGNRDGMPFCALELVEGGSLADKLAGQPLPPEQAATLVQQLALAMQHAHEAGIIHRDLKPANVLLQPDGTPKITDFGLAKQLDEGQGRTHTGAVMGTPSYMAPEQAAGSVKDIGPASDVYALGAILYELLTGRPPFRGPTVLDTLDQVRNQEPVPPRRLQPKVPRDLERVCLKCLEKERSNRYASAAQLADDLGRFLTGEPVRARPLGIIKRTMRWTKRRPALASLIVLTVFAIGLLGFVARNAWLKHVAERNERFARLVDTGDIALYRCLTGREPTWLPNIIEAHRRDAIDAYTAALEIRPNTVWPLVQRGRVHAAKKESLELALADFDTAHQLAPRHASIPKLRGHALKKLGKQDDATAAFAEAARFYPTTAEDLYWLGNIAHSKEQDQVAAHSHFSQALLLAPDHYWSLLERADHGLVAGQELTESDTRRRIAELTTAKVLRPDLPFASDSLAAWLRNEATAGWQKKISFAVPEKELRTRIERFGLDITTAHSLAIILEADGKTDEAEALLRSVLEQDRGGRTAGLIGQLKHRHNEISQAVNWYQRAISEGTRTSFLFSQLAKAHTLLGSLTAAEKAYRSAIASDPKNPVTFHELGAWYESHKRLREAEETYKEGFQLPLEVRKSAELDDLPQSVDIISDLRLCYEFHVNLLAKMGRHQEIIPLLEAAVERLQSTKAGESFANACKLKTLLGQYYVSAGRQEDVLAMIDLEMKVKPLKLPQFDMVRSLLEKLGMKERALEVGRLAEFVDWDHRSFAPARNVDGQLYLLGRRSELVGRIEMRRAMGDLLSEFDYTVLTSSYTGDHALDICKEGVERFPTSHKLWTDYMSVLSSRGRKQDAERAYETARDLFFEQVATRSKPAKPSWLGDQHNFRYLVPSLDAAPWFAYLFERGMIKELNSLDVRLREASVTLGMNPDALLVPRATAEVNAQRYADAVKTLKSCLELKQGNEGWVVPMLAQCYLNMNELPESLQWLRKGVKLTDYNPNNVSRCLTLVLHEEGVDGLAKQLAEYRPLLPRMNVRVNATLTAFGTWCAVAQGNVQDVRAKSAAAAVYLGLARKEQGAEHECMICALLLHAVAKQTRDAETLSAANEVLKHVPPENIAALKPMFALPRK